MNLDLSKASGPDCSPVVVLKICEPELSYIGTILVIAGKEQWLIKLSVLGQQPKGFQKASSSWTNFI